MRSNSLFSASAVALSALIAAAACTEQEAINNTPLPTPLEASSSSSGEPGSSSGEPGSSSGEPGSSSGEAGSSSGANPNEEPEQPDAEFMTLCAALAENLRRVGCPDLATPEASHVYINNCYNRRQEPNASCRDRQYNYLRCLNAAPPDRFACIQDETRPAAELCSDEYAAVMVCSLPE